MPRMTYALLFAALVSLPVTALAQEASQPQDHPAASPTFKLIVEPRVRHASPNDTIAYKVAVHSRIEQAIAFTVTASSDAYRYELADASLAVKPGDAARTTLTVKTGEDVVRRVAYVITGTSASGESYRAEALLDAKPRDEPRPCATAADHNARCKPNQTFYLKADPPAKRGGVNATLEYRILARALHNATIELAIGEAPAGWRVALERADASNAPAGSWILKVALGEDAAAPQKGVVVLVGSNGEERQRVSVTAAFGDASPREPHPEPVKPRPAHDEADLRKLVLHLLARIDRLEAALKAAGIRVDASADASASTTTA